MSRTPRREARRRAGDAEFVRAFLASSIVALTALAGTPRLDAANVTRNATMTATVGALAKLTLSRATLSFPAADPDTVPVIAAGGGPLTITAKGRTAIGSVITLTVAANHDLQSGLDTIPVSTISWTAAGPGFINGVLSASVAQPVASWNSSGSWVGVQSFVFANSWDYVPGTYTATLTYTLAAP